MKNYVVNCIESKDLILTGKGESLLWNQAHVLTDFSSPWDSRPINRIVFRALYSSENLFFCFQVYDSDIHIDRQDNSKSSINNSDRVELFFRKDARLNPYYCLEIDPSPRIMDFIAYPNRCFDFEWNWPLNDIEVFATSDTQKFTVEGSISIKSLEEFGLLKNGIIDVGLYRAKYFKQADGSYKPTWISWINPHTDTPNFHTASSFGKFELKKVSVS